MTMSTELPVASTQARVATAATKVPAPESASPAITTLHHHPDLTSTNGIQYVILCNIFDNHHPINKNSIRQPKKRNIPDKFPKQRVVRC